MDVLSDVLSAMRLTGGVILDADFGAPWCVLSHFGPADLAPFFPTPAHIIAYHYVRSGELLCQVGGGPPMLIKAGEIILLPRNDAHLLFSSLSTDPVDAHQLLEPGPDGGLARIMWGGEGERTTIYCGFLGSATPEAAVLQSLPNMLKVAVPEGARAEWMLSSLKLAAEELQSGSPAMVGRLAELLFVEAVRRHVESLPPGEGGWLGGFRDPAVGRALALLHARFAEDWSGEKLAREVGLSRSALADRFTALIGEPPMRYCARWRMQVAANMLKEGRQNAGNIAYEVGFSSEAAFNRAFKREYGVPPAAWRRRNAPG